MADEKLPEYVEKVVADACLAIMSKDTEPFSAADVALSVRARLREMIHRFAREREAAALERCLKIADQHADINAHGDANDALRISGAIRALIHKEPANG